MALVFLIKAKLEDGPIKPREVITLPPVIDLMAALKRSLAPDTPAISGTTAKESEPSPKPRSLRGHRTPLVA
jgi:non-homologous end joining protein Ku